uniref:Uncharacterized protein n=1 Tax=Bigelowiella natans TaxID=227086 RepID=A0A7S2KNU2_BIGNA
MIYGLRVSIVAAATDESAEFPGWTVDAGIQKTSTKDDIRRNRSPKKKFLRISSTIVCKEGLEMVKPDAKIPMYTVIHNVMDLREIQGDVPKYGDGKISESELSSSATLIEASSLGEGDVFCENLRIWNLGSNVWQKNNSHLTFLAQNGVNQLVQFLQVGINENEDEKNQKTFRTRAALETEQFGTELLLLLHKRNGDATRSGGSIEEDKDMIPFKNTGDTQTPMTNFGQLVFSALINDLSVDERLHRSDLPEWSLNFPGSLEENHLMIKTITPFPAPIRRHYHMVNPHAGPFHYFHTQRKNYSYLRNHEP